MASVREDLEPGTIYYFILWQFLVMQHFWFTLSQNMVQDFLVLHNHFLEKQDYVLSMYLENSFKVYNKSKTGVLKYDEVRPFLSDLTEYPQSMLLLLYVTI